MVRSSEDSASAKKRPKQVYPAQLLSEITVTRARHIASKFKIPNYSKLNKEGLIPLIREHLSRVESCAPCGGGPCIPDDHQFPATDPEAGTPRGSGGSDDGNTSDISNSEDSPNRQHLRALNQTTHLDSHVPGFESRTTFVSHVTDQVLVDEQTAGPSGGQPRPPSQSLSPAHTPLPVSSGDEEEDDPEFTALLREQQAQWDLEFNTTHNALAQKSKEDEAVLARRREERAARKAAKQKAIMDEALKKHQDRMASLQQPPPRTSRSSRTSTNSDNNDVFITPSSTDVRGPARSRPDSRVSFTRPGSPRSESARPADSRYHPEYSTDSRRPPRSHSTGSSLDVDVITELMDRNSESQALMAAAIEKLANATAGPGQVPISALSGFANPDGASACHKASSSGNLQYVKPGNPEMARALGVNPRVNWAFKGDMDNVDISKIKKMNLVSGKNRTNEGLVLRQHYWPHDCVSRASSHLMPRASPSLNSSTTT